MLYHVQHPVNSGLSATSFVTSCARRTRATRSIQTFQQNCSTVHRVRGPEARAYRHSGKIVRADQKRENTFSVTRLVDFNGLKKTVLFCSPSNAAAAPTAGELAAGQPIFIDDLGNSVSARSHIAGVAYYFQRRVMTSGPSATASSPVASQPLLKQVCRPAAAGGFATEEAVSTFQINPATCQVISGAFSTSSRRRRPPPRDFRRPIVAGRRPSRASRSP